MLDIKIYGDPILRVVSEKITDFNSDLKEFVEEMIDCMYEYDGVGLAAPQVGISKRLFVIDPTAGEMDRPYVFINPEITFFSDEHGDYDEGCLSIPGISVVINRPVRVSVKAFDEDGKEFEIKEAGGLLARAIQHEYDHLEGILFVDRASPVKRQLIKGKLKKLAKENKNS